MATILLTSIGSRSAIGVVQSLASIRDRIRLIATNSNPAAAGNYLADRTILVPKTAQAGEWKSALIRLLKEENPAVVLAGRDEELPLLAELKAEFPSIAFLVPPTAAVPIFNDKYETFLFARKHGLQFAESAVSPIEVQALLQRSGFPLIGKLRRGGHASRSVFLVTNEQQLDACLEAGEFVFQETLGQDTFAKSLSDWSGHLGIPWKWSIDSLDHGIDMVLDHQSVVDSCLSKGFAQGGMHVNLELVDDPVMKKTLTDYASAIGPLGFIGPLNLQGKLLPDGRYVAYELNARFVGTTIARTHLGRNLVVSALEHFGIIQNGSQPVLPGTLPVNMVERNSLFMPFPCAASHKLANTGDWQRIEPNEEA